MDQKDIDAIDKFIKEHEMISNLANQIIKQSIEKGLSAQQILYLFAVGNVVCHLVNQTPMDMFDRSCDMLKVMYKGAVEDGYPSVAPDGTVPSTEDWPSKPLC